MWERSSTITEGTHARYTQKGGTDPLLGHITALRSVHRDLFLRPGAPPREHPVPEIFSCPENRMHIAMGLDKDEAKEIQGIASQRTEGAASVIFK